MNGPRPRDAIAGALPAIGVGLLALTIFASTATPGAYWDDGGEVVVVALKRGLLHPPGHAFPSLLFGAAGGAAAVVWIGVLAGALSAACLAGRLAAGQAGPAAAACSCAIALLFATSNAIWRFATTPEVYALWAFLLVLLFALLPQLSANPRVRARRDFLAGYLGALTCATHVLALPAALAISFLRWLSRERDQRTRAALRLCCGWGMGASVLLYLPLRAHVAPGHAWGLPARWSHFVDHLLARDFSSELVSDVYRATWNADPWRSLGAEAWILCGLGLLALLWPRPWRPCQGERLALATAAGAGALLTIAFGGGMALDAYAIAALVPLTVALLRILPCVEEAPVRTWCLATALLLFGAGRVVWRWPERDLSDFRQAHEYGRALAASCPESALVLLDNTLDYFAIEEYRASSGRREDLLPLYLPMLNRPWGREQALLRLQQDPLPDTYEPGSRLWPQQLSALCGLGEAAAGRPLLYAPLEAFLLPPSELLPSGLLYRWGADAPRETAAAASARRVFLDSARGARDPHTRRRAAFLLARQAEWAGAREDWRAAEAAWQEAIAFTPEDGRFYFNLGAVRHLRGDLLGAAAAWQEASRREPGRAGALAALGRVRLELLDVGPAVQALRDALRAGAQGYEVHFNLGGALLQRGEINAAIPHLQTATLVAPDSSEAWMRLALAMELAGRAEEARAARRRAGEKQGQGQDEP